MRPDLTARRGASWPGPAFWAACIPFVPGLILFCIGAVDQIMVPGVYMDAVNPDYMIVRLLNPDAQVTTWALPGTLLFGFFPILSEIYQAALPYYVGLPVYALIGTGVVGIRLANLFFGLLVFAAASAFSRTFGVRGVLGGVAMAALALDPGFLFSFRTQFYITLLPATLLLASLALAEHRRQVPTFRVAFAAGLLAGLAVYGYFFYLFFVPTAAMHALWRWRDQPDRRRLCLAWTIGVALGGAPYLIGILLILIATGGVHGFSNFLLSYLHGLGVVSSPLSLMQRVGYFANMVWWTLLDVGPVQMMLHKSPPMFLTELRGTLLLIVPACGLIAGLFFTNRLAGLMVAAGFYCGAAVLFITFGNRLWLHHAAPLLPIMYISLGLALELAASYFGGGHARLASAAAVAIMLPLVAVNVINQQTVLFDLARTGGVGLASDAIDRFAEDAIKGPSPTYAFFPDWGVFMPFEMITRGRIPLATDFTPEAARQKLCAGQDVLLGLIDGPEPDRLPAWNAAVGWGQPDLTTYRQRDGVPVLTSVRWHAATPGHKACAT